MTTPKDDVLASLRELEPRIAARAGKLKAARAVLHDIIQQLKEVGVFRAMTPKSHGGLELDFPDFLEVISAVSEIDGSVDLAWACPERVRRLNAA